MGVETWAAIAATAAVASAGIGAAGAIHQGKATQAAAEFNAATLTQQAAREKEIAELQANQFSQAQQRLRSGMLAKRVASGVQITGSPLLVDEDAVDEIAFNEALIRAGGEVKATRLQQQADLERFSGGSARISGMFRAGGSLLQGAYAAGSVMATPRGGGSSPLRSSNLMGSFEE